MTASYATHCSIGETFLAQWKRSLPNDVSSIAYVRQALLFEQRSDHLTEDGDAVNPKPIGRTKSVLWPAVQNDLDRLTREVTGLTERAGSTFQALMATMGIVESQKAIAQAETISKLTNLAFFFIPLTLTASIFGMNIQVSDLSQSHDLDKLHVANALKRNGRVNSEPGSGSSFL